MEKDNAVIEFGPGYPWKVDWSKVEKISDLEVIFNDFLKIRVNQERYDSLPDRVKAFLVKE